MNRPTVSKINWTSLAVAGVGILSALGMLPPDLQQPITEAVMIIGPLLIMVFRTWFTGNK